jgi:hypothetical protein
MVRADSRGIINTHWAATLTRRAPGVRLGLDNHRTKSVAIPDTQELIGGASGLVVSARVPRFAGRGPGLADTSLESGEPVPGRGS